MVTNSTNINKTNKTTTFDGGIPDPGLGQAQIYDGVNPVDRIQIIPSR